MNLYMQQVNGDTVKMEAENETGRVSPPKGASKEQVIKDSIKAILDLDFTCKGTDEEMLCDDCPFDFDPMQDCGLAIIRERANMIKLEMEPNE